MLRMSSNENQAYVDTEQSRVYYVTDDLLEGGDSLLETGIKTFIREKDTDLVLDFSDVTRFGSLSLALVIRMMNLMQSHDRGMSIINASEAVLRVLEIAGIEDILE